MLMGLFKFAIAVFAVLLIVFGMIWMWSPIPFGFVFIIIGFLLLAAVAPAFIRFLRRRFGWFERFLHWLERRLPGWLARLLRRTDVDHEEEDEDEGAPRRRRASAPARAHRPRRAHSSSMRS
ncbi:hypothetical protein [Amphiplicatus metriothermophilus]|uniref:Uncharacterized protein n=1 Tax=Amphiplicatus metriothermophilus TaxID=1519374 RepID=A0A239Q0W1_9PROT|nr:hypothetical protein [Amphiplicatus metriothermophilus]MBB5520071.1 hypothetical protein [Amphiplicatus metriothermophilus]SNT75866.1 hypothetical protein SAMN06297382_2943 [Amphiplicatus metriothermophilus]